MLTKGRRPERGKGSGGEEEDPESKALMRKSKRTGLTRRGKEEREHEHGRRISKEGKTQVEGCGERIVGLQGQHAKKKRRRRGVNMAGG